MTREGKRIEEGGQRAFGKRDWNKGLEALREFIQKRYAKKAAGRCVRDEEEGEREKQT